MNQQRNLFLAFALSMLVLFSWGALFPDEADPLMPSPAEPKLETTATAPSAVISNRPDIGQLSAPDAQPEIFSKQEKEPLTSAMISFGNDLLSLKVDPGSGTIHKALLNEYRQTIDRNSEPISVLTDDGLHTIVMSTGILNDDVEVVFHLVNQETIRDTHSLMLQAELPGNRVWNRRLSMQNGSYLVSIEDKINNGGLRLYRQIVERNPEQETDTFYEHQGPIGFMDGSLKEVDYSDLIPGQTEKVSATGGWTGMMSRYFISVIIPEQSQSYLYYYSGNGITYQAGLIDEGVLKNGVTTYSAQLYLGPKSIPIMKDIGVKLERSVDFGWFAFIAKPMHDLIMFLFGFVSNFGVSIILIVVLIKILFYWPSKKSYESMAGMRKLQPEVAKLKELYGDDRQKMGQEMMGLYKKHKVNPLGGCLPIIIQIPVFFALYKVLLISIEMRQAPFIGWIQDLSVQDPFFVLPVLMGISMFVQQRLSPAPPDPVQAKLMKMLPIVFTALFLFFPAGLVLYWLVNNLLSILQQWYVMKQLDAL